VTAWAKPKDLLIAFKFASTSEWRQHLEWLEFEGYPDIAKLRAEIGRADRKGNTSSKSARGTEDGNRPFGGADGGGGFDLDGLGGDSVVGGELREASEMEDGATQDA
jgi:hypothetical protein